jgi:hypothetical protein
MKAAHLVAATVIVVLAAGCTNAAPKDATILTVVPGSGSGHILDWPDVRNLAPGGAIVERSLVSASASSNHVNRTNLDDAESVQEWFTAVETFHPVKQPFSIRYEGVTYRVLLE